jgi:catechol 2,3-dioxygenase-like lactoylglutathione lyase family enzyme
MKAIHGIYEVAIKVRDLERSERFYRDVLGLEEGLRDETRRWLFLRAGGLAGMIVLQEDRGEWPTQHFAFTADAVEMDGAAEQLRAKGVSTVGPMVHDWIPAKSLYFSDPDGHDLELCAPLEK